MTQTAVALNFDEPPHVHLRFLAEVAFDAALGFDCRTEMRQFIFAEVLDLLLSIDLRLFGQRPRSLVSNAVDRCKSDP